MLRKSLVCLTACLLIAAALCTFAYAQENEDALPQLVAVAIQKMFPNASIKETEAEQESVKMFEAGLDDNGKKMDVKVAADGTVVEVESIESLDAVPAQIAAALQQMGGKVNKIEKAVEYAKVQVVELESPVTTYEAEVVVNGKTSEVKFDANGAIQQANGDEDDDKEGDDDDDADEDEDEDEDEDDNEHEDEDDN